MPENDLGYRILNDDETALSEAYARYRAWVFRKAYHVLKCRLDAEEAVQDVFVRVWRYRHRYDAEKGSFTAWVRVITRSQLSHIYLKTRRDTEKRLDDLVFDDDDGRLPDHRDPNAKDPAEAVANSDMILRVEDALCQMDDRLMRLCFVLNYFEGYSLTDIARIVDSTVSIVKNRIKNTTRHLRHTLAE